MCSSSYEYEKIINSLTQTNSDIQTLLVCKKQPEDFPLSLKNTIKICEVNSNYLILNSNFDVNFDEPLKIVKFIDQYYTDDVTLFDGVFYNLSVKGNSIVKYICSTKENNFDYTMKYFEVIYSNYTTVPKYFQAMFINDISCKLKENTLFLYKYEEIELAIDRIIKLLQFIEKDIILEYPLNDKLITAYILSLKYKNNIDIRSFKDKILVESNGTLVDSTDKFGLIYNKLTVKNGRLRLLAYVKSSIYTYSEKPANVIVIENGSIHKKIDVVSSCHSYYGNDFIKTCNFWAFDYTCDVNMISTFMFKIELDGFIYNTTSFFSNVSCLNKKINRLSCIKEDIKISFSKNVFSLEKVTSQEKENFFYHENKRYKDEYCIFVLRNLVLSMKKDSIIWLYNDAHTVEKDNAYYQFKNDIKHLDGIKRYYIYTNTNLDLKQLFTEQELEFVILFGSYKHKILYLSSKKILTSYFGYYAVSPFKIEIEQIDFNDIIDFEIIYLQHGVLHANLRKHNNAQRCRVDKIVVSSYFEIENYIKNYNYNKDDLIKTGMARYDHIKKNKLAKSKILFAPTWRRYLTDRNLDDKWEISIEKFKDSNYYKNIQKFLDNPKLLNLLEKNNLTLDFKPHPIILNVGNLFVSNTDRINILNYDVDLTEYKVFITDFSSYVFDYAYLNRPILYFVPDMQEFKSGMNHYRELDLPFEDALGELTQTVEDTINALEKIITNNYMPEKIYSDRVDNFYLKLENCCEKLYDYLIES